MIHDTRTTGRWAASLTIGVALTFGTPTTNAVDHSVTGPPQLAALVSEALANNPEIAAARSEIEAARQRVGPAGALEDPMLEVGIVNAPLPSLSLRREEMTMTMLGLGQKLPFPGKRDLRRAVATADAESIDRAVQETVNRVVRDVRFTFEELAFNAEAQRIILRTRAELEQLAAIASSRYDVGQAVQNDVLDAQTEIEQLGVRLLRLAREDAVLQSEMQRLLGRTDPAAPISVMAQQLAAGPELESDLVTLAMGSRPQLQALQALVDRNDKAVDLAEREYYPDFDLKLQYGQRDRSPDGMPRDDMVSLIVGINLPIWRKSRLEPQVAEARAMRNQAQSMLAAEQLETRAALDAQLAQVRQWRATAELYQRTLLPQVRASVTSALAAYRVGRVDFLTLRQAQLREFEVSTDLAEAIANHNKALAEIDLLVGHGLP